MNWVDIVILGVIAGFVISSFANGFVREVVNLIGVIAAIVLAGMFYRDIGQHVQFVGESIAGIASFMAIFVVVLLIANFVSTIAHQVLGVLLGPLDGIGGGLLGVVKGFLAVEILLVVLVRYSLLGVDRAIAGSTIGGFLLAQTPFVFALLPPDFEQAVRRVLGLP